MANYKCPKCGAPIVFKPEIGGFKCDYCYSTFTEAELTASLQKAATGTASRKQTAAGEIQGYTCKNCGAEVVLGDTSNTAYCYYCHSPIVIESRLKNEFRPDNIIPFKLDKKAAVAKFLKWAKTKKYTPSDFTDKMQQEKMTGIYLPFWQADFLADIDYRATGVALRVWTSGDTEYTETTEYAIKRSGSVNVKNIQRVAFKKINNDLINAAGNYDLSEQIPFSPGYLAGFFSEQYDTGKEDVEPLLAEDAKKQVSLSISNSYEKNYAQVKDVTDNTVVNKKRMSYCLFPAWILSYVYRGKSYIFAVNGQNGNIAGEAPLSKPKMIISSVIKAAIAAGLLILGGLWIW